MRPQILVAHARAAFIKSSLAFALLLAHVFPATTQTPTNRGAATATGSVAGRVTTADGKPVANVGVALMPAEFNSPFDHKPAGHATTDVDGRYKIVGVPAGRYRLQTLAPVFTSPDERAGSPFNSGKIVTVGANEAVENIDVVLVRGGVITGRVTNAEGKPVIGERVMVTNADQPNASGINSSVVNPFEFETDDRGVYRIYGVPAGRYLVSVGQDRNAGMITVGPTPAQYARTFHPNATDAAQAKVVEVSADTEATGVDIALADAPRSYEARGRIVDETGNAVAGIGYGHGALRGDAKMVSAWGMDGAVTNAEGEFVVRNLLPGRYAVFAVNDFSGTDTMGGNYSDATQFEINDADVTGLVVKVHRGATLSGTVTIEGTTDRTVLAMITQINLYANMRAASGASADDQLSAPSFAQGHVNADGTFRLTGLRPGKVFINVTPFGNASKFTLLGVQRNSVDVGGGGIDVAAGEQVTGVRVRLGYGTSVVRGQIDLRDNGQPATLPAGARLTVAARRIVAGASSPQGASGSEVDSRGHFLIEGLMSGEYELIVTVFLPRQPGAEQPARRFTPLRQNVSVPDSGETAVTITYDLSKQMVTNP
jgi:protocatechuate 3,4-dioxygenase beta subunit